MTTQDLQQIDNLLKKRFGLFRIEMAGMLETRLQETERKIIQKVTVAFNDIVDGFEHGKADKEEVIKLEKRVSKLENVVFD